MCWVCVGGLGRSVDGRWVMYGFLGLCGIMVLGCGDVV